MLKIEKRWKVVAVDPGYRNLAWVSFGVHPISNKCELIERAHVDVGPCSKQEDIICKVWTVVNQIKPFKDADHVVIENQMIGPQTKPNNQGLAWLLATSALQQSASCSVQLMGAKRKFAVFKKECEFPHKLKKTDKGKSRRDKIKSNSIYLATHLLRRQGIDPSAVFEAGKRDQWDHLADAVNMAFVCIKGLS